MLLLLLFQVVLSSLALARQADVDMQLHDAWGRAAYQDQPLIQKLEKTVSTHPQIERLISRIFVVGMLWVCVGS